MFPLLKEEKTKLEKNMYSRNVGTPIQTLPMQLRFKDLHISLNVQHPVTHETKDKALE